jgi:hypothetical protein
MDFSWVTTDDTNAIQNAIVDAKGDLIAASANDTPARLAVGNNGETLVADSSASTGLRWTSTPSASNPFLNSAFNVWQRGTSFTVGAARPYTADRWQVQRGGLATGLTVSRQATGDTTNLPNIQYCARVQRDSGNASTALNYLWQSFESINSIPFAGKTVTFSFYARKGADYSSASNALIVNLVSGTGTDQNLLPGGYTGSSNVIIETATLTTTWQRFTFTSASVVPTTSTELGLQIYNTPVGTAGATDFFEMTGVQIDIGNTALPFRTAGVSYQQELAACQRYYYRQSANASNAYAIFGLGTAISTTSVDFPMKLPVTMRTTPSTTLEVGGTIGVTADNATIINTSALALVANENQPDTVLVRGTVVGATQYRPYILISNNVTTSYIGMSAEL